jgi:CO/xanthine dehydrogenase Mo-binding subunit
LAPLPVPNDQVVVVVKGGLFTREFRLSFNAPNSTIAAWLQTSPGTAATTPTVNGSVRTFQIKPGGGAAFAEVTIDDATGRVMIRTYWS